MNDPRKVTHADALASCRDYLRWLGAWELKVWGGPMQRDGVADLLACVKGKAVMVEVKVGRDRLRPSQERERAAFEAAGGLYIVAREGGAADVEAALVAAGLAVPCLL